MTKAKKTTYAAVAAAALALGGAGIAAASSGSSQSSGPGSEAPAAEAVHAPDSSGSRLDDGAELLPQAKISEQDAIVAAQAAATGPLNEVDLEDYQGHLAFNVDVGSSDVKVDAASGNVLAASQDD